MSSNPSHLKIHNHTGCICSPSIIMHPRAWLQDVHIIRRKATSFASVSPMYLHMHPGTTWVKNAYSHRMHLLDFLRCILSSASSYGLRSDLLGCNIISAHLLMIERKYLNEKVKVKASHQPKCQYVQDRSRIHNTQDDLTGELPARKGRSRE